MTTSYYDQVAAAAAAVRARTGAAPDVAVVLGSGLGDFAGALQHATACPYSDLPHWPVSGVVGHAGQLVVGEIGGRRVAALAGRSHAYEGYALPVAKEGMRFIVVSTQSRGDEAALHAALSVEADHVAFVGSRKKAETLKRKLAERGVDGERLARLKAPAGLDIGAVSPDEIAMSILAEIIQHRRSGKAPPTVEPHATPTEAIDPICGMTVDVATAQHRSEADGRIVYFCCRGCKTSFDAEVGRGR